MLGDWSNRLGWKSFAVACSGLGFDPPVTRSGFAPAQAESTKSNAAAAQPMTKGVNRRLDPMIERIIAYNLPTQKFSAGNERGQHRQSRSCSPTMRDRKSVV